MSTLLEQLAARLGFGPAVLLLFIGVALIGGLLIAIDWPALLDWLCIGPDPDDDGGEEDIRRVLASPRQPDPEPPAHARRWSGPSGEPQG